MEEILQNVKILMKISDTTAYDSELELAINSAVEELTTCGIPLQAVDSKLFNMYCEAIYYKVAPQLKEQYNLGIIYVSNYNNLIKNLALELENAEINTN